MKNRLFSSFNQLPFDSVQLTDFVFFSFQAKKKKTWVTDGGRTTICLLNEKATYVVVVV